MIPKFRAWHKEEKRMCNVIGIGFDTGLAKVSGSDEWTPLDSWHEFGKLILMQSTGLKDRNGKEIFEGDIVKAVCTDGEKYVFKIVFEGIMWSGRTPDGDCEVLDDFGDYPNYDLEIIGNIHENPELLKEARHDH